MRTNHPRGAQLRGFAHNLARIAALLVVLTLVAAPLFAQTVSRIEGRVEDATGAVVPNAKITAVNVKTQATSEATSNSQGLYVIPAVEAGTYNVTIEAAGFQKEVVKNLDVLAATTVSQGFKLNVGQAAETVLVEATAVAVQTTDAQISNSVTMHDIDILPVINRTPVTLAVFQPNVQINPGDQSFSHVNGQRGGSNNSKLDGIDVNDSLVPRLGLTLTANNNDSIGEFRVVTEGGKAEYGRSAGAQVEMITRTGTNQYHGNAFDYLRNTDLNADDYFNNRVGTPAPKFIQNIYGGSFGGPIIHDKTFIFGNFQGRRTRQETVRTRTVYTDNARNGLFTWKDSAGVIHTFNMLANDPRGKGIDPAMANILANVPHSNIASGGDGLNTSGFIFNNPTPSYEDQFTIRGDHNITNNNKAFLRWSWQRNSSIDNLNFADATFPGQAQGTQGGHRWGYSIGDDWTLGSTWANEFRFGHQSAQVVFARPGRLAGPTIITNLLNTNGRSNDPFNPAFAQGRNSPVNDITDNITKVRGNQTFKFGTNIRFTLQTGFNDGGIYPNVTLSASANGNAPVIPNRPAGLTPGQTATLNSLWNDLLGRMDSVAVTYLSDNLSSFLPIGTTRQRDYLLNESGYFFQDDWKLRRNLTLNLGLRWEYFGLPHEENGKQGLLSTVGQVDGVTTFTNGTFAPTDHWYNKDWNNFAPHIGFAWDVMGDGKTAIRGNFGTFYDRNIGALVNTVDGNTPGFSFSGLATPQTVAPPSGVPAGDVRISDGIPVPGVPAAPVVTLPVSNRATSVVVINPNLRTGYVNSWALNVQREITRNTVMELGYTGNRGIKLFVDQDLNALQYQGAPLTAWNQLAAFSMSGTPVPAGNPIVAMFTGPAAAATCTPTGSVIPLAPAPCAVSKIGATNLSQGNLGAGLNTIDRSFNSLYANAGLPQTFLRAYPQYNQLIIGQNGGRSYYDALTATVRRNAGGLFVNANYTYSHSIDNISVDPNGFTTPIDNRHLNLNRGNGDFDHRNSFNASFSYALPIGHGKRFGSGASRWMDEAIGDWQIGGLAVAQDGTVFTVSSQRTSAYVSGTNSTFANYSGDFRAGNIQYRPDGTVFFFTPQDLANFSFPAAGTIGNQGRNNFRGPYFVNFDASIVKKFKITEGQSLNFRAEAYNLFNHPNFGGIQTNLNSAGTFGQMTSTLATQSNGIGTGARTMQLVLRYDF